jgi:hypothetical protein
MARLQPRCQRSILGSVRPRVVSAAPCVGLAPLAAAARVPPTAAAGPAVPAVPGVARGVAVRARP